MEKNKNIKIHRILCHGDFDSARRHTLNFFADTMLLHYDSLSVSEKGSYSAVGPEFWPLIEEGIEKNRELLMGYLNELREMGYNSTEALGRLTPGYPSKVLHIAAHILDGFIGLDSAFYSLPEDSHWLSENMRRIITASPGEFYLIEVSGSFLSQQDAALVTASDMGDGGLS